MFGHMNRPLMPRNGHTLVVGIVARISGCQHQKEMSLEDQVDYAKRLVEELYQGKVEYRIIATRGKGENLERPELDQIEQELQNGELDLLIMEDLGRLVRGAEATRLLGVAVDHEVRCMVINDCIDTADETWEQDALKACGEHVGHNILTSRRIKQRLMNRFRKFGGSTARQPAGYVVPPGAKTYFDWKKIDEATPILQRGLELLKETLNCEVVAEYFNSVTYKDGMGFPPGHYCRRTTWNGSMVRRLYKNRILGGAPGRGFHVTVKRHGRGRRISVKSTSGPCFVECPNLAHVDLLELDAVNAALKEKNANTGRKKVNGVDPLFRVSRKDSKFPASVATCWYCGRKHVWGGNGIKSHLMCPGAREWHCWCSIGFDGALATTRIMELILDELATLQAFDDQFRGMVQRAIASPADLQQRQARLRRDVESLATKKHKAKEAIAAYGNNPLIKELLAEIEADETKLKGERHELEALARRQLELPQSVVELRSMLQEQFQKLTTTSRGFNDLLRKLVPEFNVYLVRLCDGGHLLPRAKVKLTLDGIAPDAQHVGEIVTFLTRERTIDLFDPPQRERIREQAVTMAGQGTEQREIARRLSVTQTAVQKALALDRTMKAMGLDSPYVLVTQPPEDYAKLRRHKNRKFKFEPLEGHRPPSP